MTVTFGEKCGKKTCIYADGEFKGALYPKEIIEYGLEDDSEVSCEVIERMMQDTLFWKAWTKRITTYKIRWDVVSTLSFIGNVKNFTVKSVSPLKLHSIDTFPELFKEMNNEK